MPLQETLDTFTYFLSEIDKLKPSFVTLVRYSKSFDVEYDGKSLLPAHSTYPQIS
jgi:hypothetical protein